MATKTDLVNVKETLKVLFDAFTINPDNYGIVSHPFTNSIAVPLKSKPNEICLLTDDNVFKLWRKQIFDDIDTMTVKDIEKWFYIRINKPYLLTVLMFIKPYIKNSLFSALLADAWVRSENPNGDVNVNITTLIEWFKEANPNKIMESEDLEYFNNLPDTITVYRGVSKGRNPYGLSWTDNKEKAEWFKDRWKEFDKNNERYLMSCTIPKEYVLCYFNTRNEKEIVVDTDKLFADKTIKIFKN